MISEVSARTGIAIDDILVRSHSREVSTVRQLYYKLLREKKCYSVTLLGRLCDRDYSTIVNGIKHANDLLESGDAYADAIWNKIKEIEA